MEFSKQPKFTIELDVIDAIVLGEAMKCHVDALMQDISTESMLKSLILQRISCKIVEFADVIAEQQKQREILLKALKNEKEMKEKQ